VRLARLVLCQRGSERHVASRPGIVRQGKAGVEWQGRQGSSRLISAQQSMAWRAAGHGGARQGKAGIAKPCFAGMVQARP
jgi:hypothetical protein